MVEDEPDNAWIFRAICEAAGCEVVIAPDLATARRLLAADEPFHLVILDLLLPDGHGLDLYREAKAMRPALPILVVTAGADEVALNGCADRFMKKPMDPDAMEAVVRELLGPSQGRP